MDRTSEHPPHGGTDEPGKTDFGEDTTGPLGSRTRVQKILHVFFWTVLFYLLSVGIAKLAEWADR